jgi:hypothetical protein
MSVVRLKFGFLIVVAFALLIASSSYATQKPVSSKRPAKKVQPAPTPQPAPQPAPPPPPSTLEQLPTSAPQVSFQNGQLVIVARNSTLGDVLRAVRNQTGANVEIPANATERVVGRFGPGPARDVLASLLNGSHFNYVMLGSATNPNALDHVIVTGKAGEVTAPASPSQPNPGNPAMASQPQGMPPGVVPPGQETQDMNEEFSEENPGTEDQADQTNQADEQQEQQPNGQPVVKTPEQLLQELQRQQQQQQPQQQAQPQQPGAPQGFPVPPGQPQPQQQPPPQPPQD